MAPAEKIAETMARSASNPGSDEWVRPAHQTRSREQRDRLLKAGERVFAKEGFWGAHVSQIAELAQCSVGSFYRRFKDKEALFFALQEDMATRAHDNIQKVFDNPDWLTRPLPEKFEEFVRNTARTIGRIEGYYRALFEMSLRGHQVWAPMRSLEITRRSVSRRCSPRVAYLSLIRISCVRRRARSA